MAITSDKAVKKEFKLEASAHPEKYYATQVLEREGYARKQCVNTSCGTFFWTVNAEQKVCGDSECSGGFRLFDKNPCTKKLSYTQVWKEFSAMFEKKGYTPISRYPTVARWNPTADFTMASIAAFQPYVVSGAVAPPAKKLVIPQLCLRFGDVDNVGITMSHLTGFVMIGQKQFVPVEEWDQAQAFQDIFDWLTTGLGLPKHEITFHEDAWAGGGNFGPCMEFFSRGIELGNQVYMMFEQTPEGPKELKLKVLDMGMGMERNAWFSQAKGSIYDATFPQVIAQLRKRTGVVYDESFMHQYIPRAAYLNLDEVEDITAAWQRVADEMGEELATVREKIEPQTALYSIAEHARALLAALADGALPSNVGGGYNLRVIYRRARNFIDQFNWDVTLSEVCAWHADELHELFPELKTHLVDAQKILAVEEKKYVENKKKSTKLIAQVIQKEIDVEKLISLYDSSGVDPQAVARAALAAGKTLSVPENFYQLVAERHEQSEQKTATRKQTYFAIDELEPTKILYYGIHDAVVFTGKVLRIIDPTHIVLDQTAFYPTSGGQEHDTGLLGGEKVIDVIKQDGIVIHVLQEPTKLSCDQEVQGIVDLARRQQLAQHHTVTHIINGAARKVLGNHVWQAGAAKTLEKGRIDITHYEALTEAQLAHIEQEANAIIAQEVAITKEVMPKNVAEKAHGFRLYQGGAVPGADIRVVDIGGIDVEACGGTHLENTAQAELVKILKSNKVQDGIVRIEFVAGAAAKKIVNEEANVLEDISTALSCTPQQIPSRCMELFSQWKLARKKKLDEFSLTTTEEYPGDALLEAARVLKTQPEHVLKTVQRFIKEIQDALAK